MITFYFIIGSILFLMLFYFLFKRNNKQKLIQPKIKTKNKWLYPTDNFGKLERGVVYDFGINKKTNTNR